MAKPKKKQASRKRSKRTALRDSFGKVDRTKMTVGKLSDLPDDVAYWRSRTPAERLVYVEYLRLINYGEAAVSGRIKKVIEITTLSSL